MSVRQRARWTLRRLPVRALWVVMLLAVFGAVLGTSAEVRAAAEPTLTYAAEPDPDDVFPRPSSDPDQEQPEQDPDDVFPAPSPGQEFPTPSPDPDQGQDQDQDPQPAHTPGVDRPDGLLDPPGPQDSPVPDPDQGQEEEQEQEEVPEPDQHCWQGKKDSGVLSPVGNQKVDGVRIKCLELTANPGSATDFQHKFLMMLADITFNTVKLVVGLASWLLGWAFKFGPAEFLLAPAREVQDVFRTQVVDRFGLPSLFLTLSGMWAGLVIMRGHKARGWGEMALSVLISALAATTLLAPAGLLMGKDGLMGTTKDTALELSSIAMDAGPSDWEKPEGEGESDTPKSAQHIRSIILTTFVVKPHQMLQFGTVFTDNGKISEACMKAYRDGVRGKKPPGPSAGEVIEQGVPFGESPAQDRSNLPGYWMKNTEGCKQHYEYNTNHKHDTDRLFGAILLLLAALLMMVLIFILVGTLLIAICGMAWYAMTGHVVTVIAIMPGGARGLFYKWLGAVAKTVLIICAVVVILPIMAIAIDGMMNVPTGDDGLIVKFALIDIVALAGLIFHRRLHNASNLFGHRLSRRMAWAEIGGSMPVHSGYVQRGPSEDKAGYKPGDVEGPVSAGVGSDLRGEIDRVRGTAGSAMKPLTWTAGKAKQRVQNRGSRGSGWNKAPKPSRK